MPLTVTHDLQAHFCWQLLAPLQPTKSNRQKTLKLSSSMFTGYRAAGCRAKLDVHACCPYL